MKPLLAWRREVRALMPEGFLRRDQGSDFLFVSDAPRFSPPEPLLRRLEAAGFEARLTGGLIRVDAGEEKYRSLLSALPCPAVSPRDDNLYAYCLAQRLLRSGASLRDQPLRLLGQWMKRLEGGDARVFSEIAACAAACQRQHRPLPAAAGRIILCALDEAEGGGFPC